MKRAIIIMAKVPRAGNVKTRLQPFLSADQCSLLAEAFLEDAINKAQNFADQLIIAFSPGTERNYFDKFHNKDLHLVEQTGSDIGERMFNALKFAFSEKTDSAIIIGTDSPTFPDDHIEQAFEFLELETDAVLGKTTDGGFYLIGSRILNEKIFENVVWSSAETFDQTYHNIMNLNLHLREVPSWYDIDEKADLLKLFNEFQQSQNAIARAPQTFKIISELFS